MPLMDLPATLAEDIILLATMKGELSRVCRLREVNKFFEAVVTKGIADNWFYHFMREEPLQMTESFRRRIINAFIGDEDRGLNGLHSQLHMVSQYLTKYSSKWTEKEYNRTYWLNQIREGLNRCQIYDDLMRLLRPGAYHQPSYRTLLARAHRGLKGEFLPTPSFAEVKASSFMVAVIMDDHELQSKMLAEGFSPNATCRYLGHPLNMACRLGLDRTVSILLAGGARDITACRTPPPALISAIRSNCIPAVKLLLASYFTYDYDDIQLSLAASNAATDGSRESFKLIMERNLAAASSGERIKFLARNGWHDILEQIFEAGVYDKQVFHTGSWPPILEAIRGGHLRTVQLLDRWGGKFSTKELVHKKILAAAASGNIALLEYILQDVQQPTGLNLVPILAAKEGHVSMLKYALDEEFHLYTKTPAAVKNSAFAAAISQGYCSTAELLIQHFYMDVNKLLVDDEDDDQYITPLLLAIDSGNSDMVRLLIRYGACAEKILWRVTNFSFDERKNRDSLARDTCRPGNGFIPRALCWEYPEVRRIKVDETLRVVLEYFPQVREHVTRALLKL